MARLFSVRRSLPVFLAILVCLVVCLALWQVWLTWRLTETDRTLAAWLRSRQRLDQAADLAMAHLSSALDAGELSVRELDTLPPSAALKAKLPPGGTFLLLTAESVVTYPHRTLLFVPSLPSTPGDLPHEESDKFESGEQLEFVDQKYDQAIETLRPLTEQPATRPEALFRIARLERKANRPEAALATYEQLSRETAVSPFWYYPGITGVPYALLALSARCETLAGLGNSRRTAAVVESLRTALVAGRWPLRRETFEYYWNKMNHLRQAPEDRLAGADFAADLAAPADFSVLVLRLYEQWQRMVHLSALGEVTVMQPDGSLLILYGTQAHLAALITAPDWLASNLGKRPTSNDIRWTWLRSGSPAAAATTADLHAVRSLRGMGELDFSFVSSTADQGLSRPGFWLIGISLLMVLLVLGGAYAIHRGVNQELHVAQLQSDFVAAVSHEFRTPLTTLCTITELLVQDRICDEPRRRQSYRFLERETSRLQRLVEDLLDFGHMESGRKQYQLEPRDLFRLVRAVVADFREEAIATGFEIETNLDPGAPTAKVDQEALSRAIRNLLENAVKYSPECKTIWVDGVADPRQVAISIRDRGMGIEPREQNEIFQKFARGTAAKKAGIAGSGIGLSMVQQIIEAFGGQIRLKSAVGAGSTFTIVLPLANSEETGG